MKVDIYIKERNGNREIRVPWLPESIEYESGGTTVATYDVLNKGEVQVPTGSGLATVSWSSQFPGKYRDNPELQRGTYYEPKHYHKILERWKKKGTELNVLVTGYPINLDVILEDYTATSAGAFGDMEYTVSFVEDRDITVKTVGKSTKKKNQNSTKKRKEKNSSTYTIKSSDTLWKIAQKKMGSGSKWKTLYNANKSIIEKTAKKHGKKSSNQGQYLYAGVKITIPK